MQEHWDRTTSICSISAGCTSAFMCFVNIPAAEANTTVLHWSRMFQHLFSWTYLGLFYVTPLVFLHKAFVSKPPVFLGPVLIYQRMNTEAYSFFAYHLQILLPSLRGKGIWNRWGISTCKCIWKYLPKCFTFTLLEPLNLHAIIKKSALKTHMPIFRPLYISVNKAL